MSHAPFLGCTFFSPLYSIIGGLRTLPVTRDNSLDTLIPKFRRYSSSSKLAPSNYKVLIKMHQSIHNLQYRDYKATCTYMSVELNEPVQMQGAVIHMEECTVIAIAIP